VLARLAGRPRLAAFRKGVTFTANSSELVTLDVTLAAATRKAAIAAAYPLTLAEVTTRLAATASKTIRLKPSAKLLGKPTKAFKARLRVVATDNAGNRTTTTRTLSVQPDKRRR
jgi:hypothetical protein